MKIPQHIVDLCHRPVGDVVADDYRRADVFKAFGIDFCCGGHRSVHEAAEAQGVVCDDLMRALAEVEQALSEPAPDHLDARSWEPDFLASYIVNVHHRYVREHGPRLRELTRTVARVHGDTNPETVQVADRFDELARELEEHTEEEERELFPYIEALCAAARGEGLRPRRPDGSLGAPIEALEHDHDRAGALLREIRALSGGFDVPDDACATFRTAYAELERFEADLHRHVHLENNVLFPAALRMERELAQPANLATPTA